MVASGATVRRVARTGETAREAAEETVASLTVSGCVNRGDFLTLAALVTEGGPNANAAFCELVGRAADGNALRWALLCAADDPNRWALVSAWPEQIRPKGQALTLFEQQAAAASVEGPAQRASAIALLLQRIEPIGVRRSLAALTLTAESAQDHLLHETARKILAGSSAAAHKDALLADARRTPVGVRLTRIDLIDRPRRQEKDAAREALEEISQTVVALDVRQIEAAQRLAAAQPADWLRDWLLGAWAYEPTRQSLINPALGSLLGAERLASLITRDTPPGIPLQLAAAAGELDDEDAAFVVAAAYRVGHVATDSMRRLIRPDGYAPSVWTVAAACQDESVARELGTSTRPGDLINAAKRLKGEPRAAHLIVHAADTWSTQNATSNQYGLRVPPAEWDTEMQGVTAILGDPVLVTLAQRPGPGFAYPPGVLDLVLDTPDAVVAFCEAQLADQLVDHAATAGARPAQAVALLTQRPDDVDANQVRLLGAVGWEDLDLWTTAIDACDLETVVSQLKTQVESLTLPLAERAPVPVLRSTLRRAVRAGITNELGSHTVTVAGSLLAHDDDETVADACQWVTRMEVTESEHNLVHAVIQADDLREHRHPDLVELRAHLARKLCANVRDRDLNDETRIAHLKLAAIADPAGARSVALTVTKPEADELRLAAAHILAQTDGQPSDEAAIDALLADAKKAPLSNALKEARVALTAPDLGTALTRLADNLDAIVTPKDVTDARLGRYPDQEATLLQLVNDVRASSNPGVPAKDYLNSAVTLCDHMVDLAILATTDAGKNPYKKTDVDAIRTGARNRPDAGALVNAQSVLNVIPWASHVASLRQQRAAHPNRTNSTAPVVITDKDRAHASYILGQVLRNWLDTMIGN